MFREDPYICGDRPFAPVDNTKIRAFPSSENVAQEKETPRKYKDIPISGWVFQDGKKISKKMSIGFQDSQIRINYIFI